MTQTNYRNRLCAVGAATLSLVFLAGCATPTAPVMDEQVVRQFASKGYLNDAKFGGIATTYFSWLMGSAEFDIALTQPTHSGSFPLVIYLPGMGESRTAGEIWRTTWAEAGYAVLTLQPLNADRDAWLSPQARAGNFTELARMRFTEKEMASRITVLRQTLAELKRRQLAQDAQLNRIDLSRITLAGYDLGADTALQFAADNQLAAKQEAWPVNTVIAISPSKNGVAEDALASIHIPVLLVTGDSDVNPLETGSSKSRRRNPFAALPADNKFLLTLNRCNHQQLSGASLFVDTEASSKPKEQQQRHRGRNDEAGKEPAGKLVDGKPVTEGADLPTAQALGSTVFRSVSHAFLDAYIRNDELAGEWLNRQSKRWAGRYADIQTK